MFSFWSGETQPPKSQASGQPQANGQPQNPGYQPAYGQQPPPYGTGAPNTVQKETRKPFLHVAALAIGSIGLLFAVIGVSSNHWYDTDNEDLKKFKGIIFWALFDCTTSTKIDVSGLSDSLLSEVEVTCEDWVVATQAMIVLGIIATGFGVILLHVDGIPIVAGLAGLACLGGGICLLIGAIIFGVKRDEFYDPIYKKVELTTGWSFALVIVAGILELGAGVLVVANALRSLLKKK